MLSDRDMRTLVGNASRRYIRRSRRFRMQSLRVADAGPDAFVVRREAPFADVVRVFTDQRVGAVPVVDDADRLVGIISYVDVFQNAGALWFIEAAARRIPCPRPLIPMSTPGTRAVAIGLAALLLFAAAAAAASCHPGAKAPAA